MRSSNRCEYWMQGLASPCDTNVMQRLTFMVLLLRWHVCKCQDVTPRQAWSCNAIYFPHF